MSQVGLDKFIAVAAPPPLKTAKKPVAKPKPQSGVDKVIKAAAPPKMARQDEPKTYKLKIGPKTYSYVKPRDAAEEERFIADAQRRHDEWEAQYKPVETKAKADAKAADAKGLPYKLEIGGKVYAYKLPKDAAEEEAFIADAEAKHLADTGLTEEEKQGVNLMDVARNPNTIMDVMDPTGTMGPFGLADPILSQFGVGARELAQNNNFPGTNQKILPQSAKVEDIKKATGFVTGKVNDAVKQNSVMQGLDKLDTNAPLRNALKAVGLGAIADIVAPSPSGLAGMALSNVPDVIGDMAISNNQNATLGEKMGARANIVGKTAIGEIAAAKLGKTVLDKFKKKPMPASTLEGLLGKPEVASEPLALGPGAHVVEPANIREGKQTLADIEAHQAELAAQAQAELKASQQPIKKTRASKADAVVAQTPVQRAPKKLTTAQRAKAHREFSKVLAQRDPETGSWIASDEMVMRHIDELGADNPEQADILLKKLQERQAKGIDKVTPESEVLDRLTQSVKAAQEKKGAVPLDETGAVGPIQETDVVPVAPKRQQRPRSKQSGYVRVGTPEYKVAVKLAAKVKADGGGFQEYVALLTDKAGETSFQGYKEAWQEATGEIVKTAAKTVARGAKGGVRTDERYKAQLEQDIADLEAGTYPMDRLPKRKGEATASSAKTLEQETLSNLKKEHGLLIQREQLLKGLPADKASKAKAEKLPKIKALEDDIRALKRARADEENPFRAMLRQGRSSIKATRLTNPKSMLTDVASNVASSGTDVAASVFDGPFDWLLYRNKSKEQGRAAGFIGMDMLKSTKGIGAKMKAEAAHTLKGGNFSRYDSQKGPLDLIFNIRGLSDVPTSVITKEAVIKQLQRINPKMSMDEIVAVAEREMAESIFANDNIFSDWWNKLPPEMGAGLDLLVPFPKVPSNYASRVADFTPLGAIRGLAEAGLRGKNVTVAQRRNIVRKMSRSTVGTSAAALVAYFGNKLYESGFQPDKVNVQGKYIQWGQNPVIDLDQIGPLMKPVLFTMGLRAVDDAKLKSGKPLSDASKQSFRWALLLSVLADYPAIRGAETITDLKRSPEKGTAKIMSQHFVPGFIKWFADLQDSINGEGGKYRETKEPLDELKKQFPFLRQQLPIKD